MEITDSESGKPARRPARPRPKAITLSDAAAARVKEIMGRADGKVVGVRVSVKNTGCAGMSYAMEYASEVSPLDEKVEDKDVTILIDPKAVLFLIGTEMDYKTDKFESGFVFKNPNAVDTCGCGESFRVS
ncbi:MAG: iron-sulfur cluster assembly accessory protein [Alphaproteobacteria bacterium]|nr:iron-sulfur cluster assembly accessory protein [Alphaproteobacteria bacterium]